MTSRSVLEVATKSTSELKATDYKSTSALSQLSQLSQVSQVSQILESSSEAKLVPAKRKKKKKKKDPFLKLNGVKKIPLTEFTQKYIGCIAGQDITVEDPWIYVSKALVLENLENFETNSEFYSLEADIKKYPGNQIYFGLVADDSKDDDDFYLCFQDESIPKINELVANLKKERNERMYNSIYRAVRPWISMGSEVEVDEGRIKNNRPLIEVEVEAGYPLNPPKKDFDMSRAEDRRDGYMELRVNPDDRKPLVQRKRVDVIVQQAAQFVTKYAQTTCAYPMNASTQYLYEIGDVEPLLAACLKPFKAFVKENLGTIADMLKVNAKLNLYSEDYFTLIKDSAKFISASVVEDVKEYMSFMDVELCTGKMVSDVVFHPMWTGIAAVAYNIVAPFIYTSGPSSEEKTSSSNLVLIWSCVDGLKPKLMLKAPREVIKLSFCKFDENVLLGGLKNGQIIIWDIRNKLQQIEDVNILSHTQIKNRAYMKTLMSWMKIIYDVCVVEPTAISDMKYSHKGAVIGINWVSPFYEFDKLGKVSKIEEDAEQPYSMQFITGGEDGNVLIWDLMKVPQTSDEGFKPRKLKRLKQKPASLAKETSPYSVHNLTLKPLYKIVVPSSKKKPLAAVSCNEDFCPILYEEANPHKTKKLPPLNERVIYKPILNGDLYPEIKPQIYVGSMEGDFIKCVWEGQDFDSGEMINNEFGIVKSRARIHDGPLITMQKNPEFDITLSVGGKIFALWNDQVPNKPLFWKKAKEMYTSGEWNVSHPYMFTNKLVNGDVEEWSLAFSSKIPNFSLTFSSGYLTASAFHTLKQKRTIYAAADKLGCLRLFLMPEDPTPGTLQLKKERFQRFIEREVRRKKYFFEWQTSINKKIAAAAGEMEEVVEDAVSIAPTQIEEIPKPEEKQPKMERKPKQEEVSLSEKIIRRRQKEEEAIIRETLIVKKQLDIKELERRRKPLLKLEEENERKKRKQKQRLKEGENIFLDTVCALFPDVMKEKPPPPPNPYESVWVTQMVCEQNYENFLEIKKNATVFIEDHPYNYVFNLNQVLLNGQKKRNMVVDPHNVKAKARELRALTRFGDKTVEKELPPVTFNIDLTELELQTKSIETISIKSKADLSVSTLKEA
ncbi:unnamed protein product [Phyllotreta striolata]|uniref:WD repeat-containing protein 63 n=1 Tax=Phyllotreta striolata TaxID=444603 RepID=A0A9N9XQY5_PHYSR|nr:unnamed protein product [Phyllotreta striolata]